MNFEQYQQQFYCEDLERTEQSYTFKVDREGQTKVVKKYPTPFDKCKEELAYAYITSKNLLQVPQLSFIGEDFIEMQFLQSAGSPTNAESIEGIAHMYKTTQNNSHPRGYFPKIDLSKNKLLHRLTYIPQELEKRGLLDRDLLHQAELFVDNTYDPSPHQCLVHGDLKSVHVIKTADGIFFIDLALVSMASPWYDLAFLFMQKKEREGELTRLTQDSLSVLSSDFQASKEEVNHYLESAIFYRSLYDVGFAARHRPDKPLKRVINNLKDLLTSDTRKRL